MRKRTIIEIIICICLISFSTTLQAAKDMAGSRDHPEIPRIEGTVIFGYAYSDYDEGDFITAFKAEKLQTNIVGGKRTRILYLAPLSISLPQVFKNYGVALSELGEREQIYSCSGSCASNLGDAHIWAERRRIPTNLNSSDFIYSAGFGYRDQGYSYWTVTNAHTRYHVSVYTAILTGIQAKAVANMRAIHIDVVEEADFNPTLQVVTPDEITESIKETGHVALYGIYFDFDKDALKPDSTPALEAIATALNSNSSLKIYVVGHTDNQGSYEYNLGLSKRRAASVVSALTDSHGVTGDRLIAAGVGPVAPVASNRTEEGQALNRRVELVEL